MCPTASRMIRVKGNCRNTPSVDMKKTKDSGKAFFERSPVR